MNKIKYNEWLQTYEVILARSGDEAPDYKTLAELYDDVSCVLRVKLRDSTQVRPIELYDKVEEYGGDPRNVLSESLLQGLPSKGEVLNQLEGAWRAFVSQQWGWAGKQGWTGKEINRGVEEAARMCFQISGTLGTLRSDEKLSPWRAYTRVLATARESLESLRVCTFAPGVAISRETLSRYLWHLNDMELAKTRLAYVKEKAGRVEYVTRVGDFFEGTLRDVFVWSGDAKEPTWSYGVGDFHYTGEVLSMDGGMVVVRPFAVESAKE